jgi:tetratricopeptide (TPR) repeat protein
MKRFLTLTAAALVALVGSGLLLAQAAQTPPAGQQQPGQPAAKKQPAPKTKEEYDAYQKFWGATTPDDKIKFSEEFLQKYPDSELKAWAYRKEMEAYQQKNDFEHMREFGEKAIEAEPNDVMALLLLAGAIPERTKESDLDRDEKLNTAEKYSKRALEAIEKMEKPSPQYTDAQWDAARNDARSQVHAALGLVNLHRKNYTAAEESFRKATQLQTQPDPVVWWRLGLTLQFLKKYEDALTVLDKAVSLGGVKVGDKDFAVEERDRVKKFLDQRKAAGTPPAGTAKPPQI